MTDQPAAKIPWGMTPQADRVGIAISLVILLGLAFPWMNPEQPSWIVWLMLWSPGMLMPLGEKLADRHQRPLAAMAYLFILVSLWICMAYPPGLHSGEMSLPWLAVRTTAAGIVAFFWLRRPTFAPWALCLDAARVFPVIGAAWFTASRFNYQPFGFDALIVLLTAAHFHHAGFSLPLMAGLCGRELPGRLSRFSCGLILAGVPLVAIGITSTHFKVLPWMEPLSVLVLVLGAWGIALLQIQMARRPGLKGGTRFLFLLSGISLFIAMLLALTYGLRSVFPALSLSMPHMWAVHGTLNTFGFGLCGVLAWRGVERLPKAER